MERLAAFVIALFVMCSNPASGRRVTHGRVLIDEVSFRVSISSIRRGARPALLHPFQSLLDRYRIEFFVAPLTALTAAAYAAQRYHQATCVRPMQNKPAGKQGSGSLPYQQSMHTMSACMYVHA